VGNNHNRMNTDIKNIRISLIAMKTVVGIVRIQTINQRRRTAMDYEGYV